MRTSDPTPGRSHASPNAAKQGTHAADFDDLRGSVGARLSLAFDYDGDKNTNETHEPEFSSRVP